MAKKQKFESNEEVVVEVAPVVELNADQLAVQSALASESPENELQQLKDAETTPENLKVLITVYLALAGALGFEAGATIAARTNLEAYTPAKIKVPKEKAFNEIKALKDTLASEEFLSELVTLQDDERISDELKIAIQTYVTLANLPLDQAIIDGAKETLANFGRKGKSGTRAPSGPRVAFGIEVNGVVFSALTAAIAAQGITKEITGENKSDDADIAWRTIRPKLLKDGVAEYNGVTYTKTDAPATEEPEEPVEKTEEAATAE
jgi:hypothetical protein